MSDPLTPADIKRIRGKYGLTQQGFARVLGIGDASIARYENGATPSRSISNLIRAADNPEFMLDCLNRDGNLLSRQACESARQVIYAQVTFDEEGHAMDVNELFDLTLEQDMLNDHMAAILADLHKMQNKAEDGGDAALAATLEIIIRDVAIMKPTILDDENFSKEGLARLRGSADALKQIALALANKAA